MNDETVVALRRQAQVCAAAGSNVIAPPDMMQMVGSAPSARTRCTGSSSRRSWRYVGEIAHRRITDRSAMPSVLRRISAKPTNSLYQMDPAQQRRSIAGKSPRHRRGRRHGDGEARHAVSRHRRPRERRVRRSDVRLSGERRIRDANMAAIERGWLTDAVIPRVARLHQARGRRRDLSPYFAKPRRRCRSLAGRNDRQRTQRRRASLPTRVRARQRRSPSQRASTDRRTSSPSASTVTSGESASGPRALEDHRETQQHGEAPSTRAHLLRKRRERKQRKSAAMTANQQRDRASFVGAESG